MGGFLRRLEARNLPRWIQQGETAAAARLMLYHLAFIAGLTAIFVPRPFRAAQRVLLALLRKRAALVKFNTAALFPFLFLSLVSGQAS